MAVVTSGKMDVALQTLQGVKLFNCILMSQCTLIQSVALDAELLNNRGVDTSRSCITCNYVTLLCCILVIEMSYIRLD